MSASCVLISFVLQLPRVAVHHGPHCMILVCRQLYFQTTQTETGQQWDGANCWPPLIQMAVEEIAELGNQDTVEAVRNMTDRYILSCMQAYKRLGALREKSYSSTAGLCGVRGGYKHQTGFVWSIGVALELLFVTRASFCAKEVQQRRRRISILQAGHSSRTGQLRLQSP